MNPSDQIQFFSDMLLQVSQIFTWTYNAQFGLESTNCSIPELGAYQNRNAFLFDILRSRTTSLSVPAVLSDELGFLWISVAKEIAADARLYMLGPILPADAPISGISHQLQMSGMNKKEQAAIMRFVEHIPTLSLTNIFQYAIMFAYTVSNQVYQLSDIQMPAQERGQLSDDTDMDDHKNAQGNYAFECFFVKLIEEGNLQYAELLGNYEALGPVGKLSTVSSLQNEKNTCIVTVTLCCRAAMRGGLPPETSYRLSDYYIQAIDSAKSISEVYAHHSAMLDDYIHKVHQHKELQQNCSKMIADADAYIDIHLTENISIENIAQALGYSKYYFSTTFKKKTQKNVNDYIREKRLDYAKIRLRTSQDKIAQLSEQLHFISPSYFTKCFKEYTGMTPNEFRNQQ